MVETLGQKYPQYQFSYGKTENSLDIKDNVAGILSVRNGSSN